MHPAQGLERELPGVVGQDHSVGQQPMSLDRAPQRAFGGDTDRVGIQVGDAKSLEMLPPRRLVGEVPVGMVSQGFDDRASQGALAHVGQGLGVDDVVAIASPQHFQEIQPALRGGEGGEVIVADLRAVAVPVPVAGAGIIHTDPGRRFQPGPQHGVIDEGAGVRVQQTDDLALGDHDADGPELAHQARHGDLTLMVLQQHETAQLRPKVTSNPGRHRRENGLPVGREPAFPADAYDMRAQHEILDDEVLVALEARPGRHVDLDDALLINDQLPGLALPGAALAGLVRRLRLGLRLHAARPDRRAPRHTLELGNLRAQIRHHLLQRGVLRQQAFGQGLEVATRQL
jgi:hypothetical protein